MRVRHIITIVLLNIFLLLSVSVINEYIQFRTTTQQMGTTVQLAVDMALDTSLRSEEFFTEQYSLMTSTGAVLGSNSQHIATEVGGPQRALATSLSLYRDGEWFAVNPYVLAMHYGSSGRMPLHKSEYDAILDEATVQNIYSFLFGGGDIFGANGLGSDIYLSEYDWARSNPDGLVDTYSSNKRQPSAEFQYFYDHVGNEIYSLATITRPYSYSDGYGGTVETTKFEYEFVPALTNMGLKLNNYNLTTSASDVYNSNFLTIIHEGHARSVEGGISSDVITSYMFTPYSLGVTYVPQEVLKVSTLANLESLIRFNKCRAVNSADMTDVYTQANGCIGTTVYDGGVDAQGRHVSSGTAVEHSGRADGIPYNFEDDYVMNDGDIEYELDTLQLKVDYFVVDFYDNGKYKIVNFIEGATPGEDVHTLPSRLAVVDTYELPDGFEDFEGFDHYSPGKRVVAKVTAKIKVHIPYKSGVLQWASRLYNDYPENHYDVPLWDANNGSIVEDSSGVWYTYTTYAAISR